MVDLRSCMHTISLSYCCSSFILVVACIACRILPLSDIFIRASAHSWLGLVFLSTDRRSSHRSAIGSSCPAGQLATAPPRRSRSQGPWRALILSFVRRGVPDDPYFCLLFI